MGNIVHLAVRCDRMGDVDAEWAMLAAKWAMIDRMGDAPNGRCTKNSKDIRLELVLAGVTTYSVKYHPKTCISKELERFV